MDRLWRQLLASVPPLKRVWAASQEALRRAGTCRAQWASGRLCFPSPRGTLVSRSPWDL